jgi:GxxExxY protein
MKDDAALTEVIIGRAIEVHRGLGPGMLESAYEEALSLEFDLSGLSYRRQVGVPVVYKGRIIGEHRPDFVVCDHVVVELKSVDRLAPVHRAQTLMYMRLVKVRLGLVLNFNTARLKDGIQRLVL